MIYGFPPNIRIRSIRPRPEGLRNSGFTNIDGETFARPTLNGFWRVEMTLLSGGEDEHLALTAFLTAMRGNATTILPMTTLWLPNDNTGRKLSGFGQAPEYGVDHTGFQGAPFGGFTLRREASRRDSYINVDKPGLSSIKPGHAVTLGTDRYYRVLNVVPIAESPTAVRLSVWPPLRADHAYGARVTVDHLRLKAQLESADDPEDWNIPTSEVKATFIEAF